MGLGTLSKCLQITLPWLNQWEGNCAYIKVAKANHAQICVKIGASPIKHTRGCSISCHPRDLRKKTSHLVSTQPTPQEKTTKQVWLIIVIENKGKGNV